MSRLTARHATKIVATLGPASSSIELLEQMILNKVSVVRLNFSHGTAQDHINRAAMVREAARRAGREVAIKLASPEAEPWPTRRTRRSFGSRPPCMAARPAAVHCSIPGNASASCP